MNLKTRIMIERHVQEKNIAKRILMFFSLSLLFYLLVVCIPIKTTEVSSVSGSSIASEEVASTTIEETKIEETEPKVVQPDKIIVEQKEIDREKIKNDILLSNKKTTEEEANSLAYNIVNIADIDNINPFLLAAVIKTESNYTQESRSDAGAVGLGQLTEVCATEIGRRTGVSYNRYNSIENIKCSSKYLSLMIKKFHDTNLALAAYNVGETSVAENNSIPNIPETKNYVIKVNQAIANY